MVMDCCYTDNHLGICDRHHILFIRSILIGPIGLINVNHEDLLIGGTNLLTTIRPLLNFMELNDLLIFDEALTKDEASLTTDEASLTKDEASLTKDEASLTKDASGSLAKDESGLLTKDASGSLTKDASGSVQKTFAS